MCLQIFTTHFVSRCFCYKFKIWGNQLLYWNNVSLYNKTAGVQETRFPMNSPAKTVSRSRSVITVKRHFWCIILWPIVGSRVQHISWKTMIKDVRFAESKSYPVLCTALFVQTKFEVYVCARACACVCSEVQSLRLRVTSQDREIQLKKVKLCQDWLLFALSSSCLLRLVFAQDNHLPLLPSSFPLHSTQVCHLLASKLSFSIWVFRWAGTVFHVCVCVYYVCN